MYFRETLRQKIFAIKKIEGTKFGLKKKFKFNNMFRKLFIVVPPRTCQLKTLESKAVCRLKRIKTDCKLSWKVAAVACPTIVLKAF